MNFPVKLSTRLTQPMYHSSRHKKWFAPNQITQHSASTRKLTCNHDHAIGGLSLGQGKHPRWCERNNCLLLILDKLGTVPLDVIRTPTLIATAGPTLAQMATLTFLTKWVLPPLLCPVLSPLKVVPSSFVILGNKCVQNIPFLISGASTPLGSLAIGASPLTISLKYLQPKTF